MEQPEIRARENELKRERWPKYYAEHREKELDRGKAKHQRFREKDNARERGRYQDNIEKRREKSREKATEIRRLAKLAKAVSKGRPRNESLLARTLELKAQGKSYGKIAIQIKAKSKSGKPLTTDAYRNLVKRHERREKSADETLSSAK